MNAARLRSKLCMISPDLQNLTVKEVEDCSWSFRLRTMSTLLREAGAGLAEEAQSLEALAEARQATHSSWRQSSTSLSVSKEVRQEYERDYRLRCHTLFLQSLEKMRWPPALEAFSNPLRDLQDETRVFLEATAFLVEILFAHRLPARRPSTTTTSSSSSTTPATPAASHPPSDPGLSPSSTTAAPALLSKSSMLQVNQSPRAMEMSCGGGDVKSLREEEENEERRAEMTSFLSAAPSSSSSQRSQGLDSQVQSQLQQVLTQQNGALSRRLAVLENSLQRRVETEHHIEALMRSSKMALADLTNLRSESGQTNKTSPARDVTSTDSGLLGPGRVLSRTLSAVHDSLGSLERQWTEASQAGRRAMRETSKAAGQGGSRAAFLHALLQLYHSCLAFLEPRELEGYGPGSVGDNNERLARVCDRMEEVEALSRACEQVGDYLLDNRLSLPLDSDELGHQDADTFSLSLLESRILEVSGSAREGLLIALEAHRNEVIHREKVLQATRYRLHTLLSLLRRLAGSSVGMASMTTRGLRGCLSPLDEVLKDLHPLLTSARTSAASSTISSSSSFRRKTTDVRPPEEMLTYQPAFLRLQEEVEALPRAFDDIIRRVMSGHVEVAQEVLSSCEVIASQEQRSVLSRRSSDSASSRGSGRVSTNSGRNRVNSSAPRGLSKPPPRARRPVLSAGESLVQKEERERRTPPRPPFDLSF
eukprot:scaffold4592_cov169-Ochromonas_danica.AAC.8